MRQHNPLKILLWMLQACGGGDMMHARAGAGLFWCNLPAIAPIDLLIAFSLWHL